MKLQEVAKTLRLLEISKLHLVLHNNVHRSEPHQTNSRHRLEAPLMLADKRKGGSVNSLLKGTAEMGIDASFHMNYNHDITKNNRSNQS